MVMNSRSSSISAYARRRSRTSTFSSVEQVHHATVPDPAVHSITEEIAEIKRYEDFTTIDWVQDDAREQLRRRARREQHSGSFGRKGVLGWRQKVRDAYDAGQAWLVVTIVGAVIGLNAAALNIITEWLSDVKLGYCSTAFYLNEQFCCWGAENGCEEWKRWTSLGLANYVIYTIYSILLAFVAAFLVKQYAVYAAGSGISEIKCIIAGFVMQGFLGFWTFFVKSICLPFAIASGLSVGKEGPSVHYAVCVGNIISRYFDKYRRNAAKTREILTATAAAGVAVAFGSPIGGVLFALEEMATYFPLKTLWRSYFCALVATAVLAAMNPFRTGQLVMFQVKYDRTWHFFEIIFFVLIGVFGGLYGAFVMKWNLRAQAFRKKYLTQYAIPEAAILAGATAILCYPNMFLRIDMTEMMEMLFQECEGGHDYDGICETKNRWSTVISLCIATVLRVLLVIISYGCKVPAGIFVPSMAVGASFGRMVGILVQALHESFPKSQFFSACEPDVPCITPGTYAFLGAGAALSGIMHITISVTVIMFELTGALTYILPTMIVVGISKAVGDRFGKGGIADRMIWFNGFPFLDNKEEHSFGVPVSHVMTSRGISILPASRFRVSAAEQMLRSTPFSGFPILQDAETKILLGYIGRTELRFAIDRARKQGLVSPTALCSFVHAGTNTDTEPRSDILQSLSPITSDPRASLPTNSSPHPPITFDAIASSSGQQSINFSPFVDATPITVHPRLPLETVMELFKKMGPRVILVEHRGRLVGLVTIKDCLKYQFKVEASSHGDGGGGGGAGTGAAAAGDGHQEERLWQVIISVAEWLANRLASLSHVGAATGGRGFNSASRSSFAQGAAGSRSTTSGAGSGSGSRTGNTGFRDLIPGPGSPATAATAAAAAAAVGQGERRGEEEEGVGDIANASADASDDANELRTLHSSSHLHGRRHNSNSSSGSGSSGRGGGGGGGVSNSF